MWAFVHRNRVHICWWTLIAVLVIAFEICHFLVNRV